MKKKIFLCAILLSLGLCSCNKKEQPIEARYFDESVYAMEDSYQFESAVNYEMMAEEAADTSNIMAKSASSEAVNASGSTTRMIKKDASITIQVLDPNSVMDELITMTENFGGFVVSTDTGNEYYTADTTLPYALMTVRVPAEKLMEALDFIEGTTSDRSKYVTKKEITGKDITREYVDNQSRLEGMERTRDKLYEILDTAENAEEALAIYNNISSVETDIQILKGEAKYMEEAVAYSSITIRINSIRPAAIATAQKWEPIEAVKDAFAGLIEFGQHLIEFLIYFIIIGIPCIALIGLIVWGITKICKKLFKKKKSTANKPEKTVEKQDAVE